MDESRGSGICQFVVYFFAGAAVDNQSGLAQDPQVMRNGRSAHINSQRNVVDALLAMCQQLQNAQPGRIAKLLKDFRGENKSFFCGHCRQNFIKIFTMMM